MNTVFFPTVSWEPTANSGRKFSQLNQRSCRGSLKPTVWTAQGTTFPTIY